MALNQNEQNRLAELQAIPVAQQTTAQKTELAALLHKRDHE
jgi:hypothetical protein